MGDFFDIENMYMGGGGVTLTCLEDSLDPLGNLCLHFPEDDARYFVRNYPFPD